MSLSGTPCLTFESETIRIVSEVTESSSVSASVPTNFMLSAELSL
jgi:hypothetical protein